MVTQWFDAPAYSVPDADGDCAICDGYLNCDECGYIHPNSSSNEHCHGEPHSIAPEHVYIYADSNANSYTYPSTG